MTTQLETRNKALVLEAFDTLFNKRGYAAAVRFWSSNYVPHSGHIEPGRQGVFKLIKGAPASLKFEPGGIVADGDDALERDAPGTGSPLTSCAPTVCWPKHWDPRMRGLAQSQRVVCQCSALSSACDRGLDPEQTICIRTSRSHQSA
jgi:hypothetical protein